MIFPLNHTMKGWFLCSHWTPTWHISPGGPGWLQPSRCTPAGAKKFPAGCRTATRCSWSQSWCQDSSRLWKLKQHPPKSDGFFLLTIAQLVVAIIPRVIKFSLYLLGIIMIMGSMMILLHLDFHHGLLFCMGNPVLWIPTGNPMGLQSTMEIPRTIPRWATLWSWMIGGRQVRSRGLQPMAVRPIEQPLVVELICLIIQPSLQTLIIFRLSHFFDDFDFLCAKTVSFNLSLPIHH